MDVYVRDGSIPGELLGGQVRRTRTFLPRRICAVEGCKTILSIYNPRPRCAIHLG